MGDEITGQRLLELTCEALLRVHCNRQPSVDFSGFFWVKFVRKTGKNTRKMGTLQNYVAFLVSGNPLIIAEKTIKVW